MKKMIFLIVSTTLIYFSSFAQRRPAVSCGGGCYTVTAKVRNDQGCGGNFDYTYTITNNSNQELDIEMYVEKRNGEWKDLGLIENVSSGRIIKDAFWSCDLSGRYFLYYRISGTDDKFPTSFEINNKARTGY